MTVEADIFSALQGLVSNRVFPDIAPLDTPLPYITFQQIGGEAIGYMDNTVPDAKNGRFQVDVWSQSRIQCAALALQIEAAMVQASVFQARPVGAPSSQYEPDTKLYGSLQDFTVWSTR